MPRFFMAFVCCSLFLAASALGQEIKEIKLFEKKNLADWVFHADKEGAKVSDTFSFTEDGRLLCTGQPFGYLATKEEYENFKFAIEYRWAEGKEPTNSGIFLRIADQPKDTFLPQAVEVQLKHKEAGDLWGFHGWKLMNSAVDRYTARESEKGGKVTGIRKLLDAEKEPGQWNAMEILYENSTIVVVVNGRIVNMAYALDIPDLLPEGHVAAPAPPPGRLGIQSEGGPIEFRNAVLTVLP
jgi:hypothetical protein